jgi:hypothetical protein
MTNLGGSGVKRASGALVALQRHHGGDAQLLRGSSGAAAPQGSGRSTMEITRAVDNLLHAGPFLRNAIESRNVQVLSAMLGPAFRGIIAQRGKTSRSSAVNCGHDARFSWSYDRDKPDLARLYELAKKSQWNASSDVDWSIAVDPEDDGRSLLPDDYLPVLSLPTWGKLTHRDQRDQRRALLAWLLSQFLHGEQGALFAAAQIVEGVPWLDAKLFGSTQVVDEARHVEVFHGYLTRKLQKLYEINDSLYVIIDAVCGESAWDMKFLGMQIMVEGLALGAFATLRQATREPLLQSVLKYVVSDEARHVKFGLIALRSYYEQALSERERRYREDWVWEVSLQMRNRFLAHEFYDEYWGHAMSRRTWDSLVLRSPLMEIFRTTMFKRIVPNLAKLGLLSDRVKPRYAALGVLQFQDAGAATELTTEEVLRGA